MWVAACSLRPSRSRDKAAPSRSARDMNRTSRTLPSAMAHAGGFNGQMAGGRDQHVWKISWAAYEAICWEKEYQELRHNVWANYTYRSFTQLPSLQFSSPLAFPCTALAKTSNPGFCQLSSTLCLLTSAKLGRLAFTPVGNSSHGRRHHGCSHRGWHSSRPCWNSMASGLMVSMTSETRFGSLRNEYIVR